MNQPLDLHPAAERLAGLVEVVGDSDLERPTPCERYAVGDLLDHVAGFALAFRAAAVKQPLDAAPSGAAAALPPDWRSRIPADLRALAVAWDEPGAWEGMTAAGSVDLPGDLAGVVALDELVLHGWDLAVALGRPANYDGPGLEAVHEAVGRFRASGIDGLFGPEVPIAHDAPLLERTLGLSGRDPSWSPSAGSEREGVEPNS